MTDYKYEELIEDLKDQKKLCEQYLRFAKEELKKYRGKFGTDDKFEVANNEYWRGIIRETELQIMFLKSVLEKQESIILEEINQMEQAENFSRELRQEAHFGI